MKQNKLDKILNCPKNAAFITYLNQSDKKLDLKPETTPQEVQQQVIAIVKPFCGIQTTVFHSVYGIIETPALEESDLAKCADDFANVILPLAMLQRGFK